MESAELLADRLERQSHLLHGARNTGKLLELARLVCQRLRIGGLGGHSGVFVPEAARAAEFMGELIAQTDSIEFSGVVYLEDGSERKATFPVIASGGLHISGGTTGAASFVAAGDPFASR